MMDAEEGRGHRRCSTRVILKDWQETTDSTGELFTIQKGKQFRKQRQMAAGVEGRGQHRRRM